jgi:hypothetical protein
MRKSVFLWPGLLIFASILVLAPTVWAADFTAISTADLKNKLDTKEKLLLVNSLSDIEFGLEHIPGSVNIPVGEMQTTDKLPADKGTLLVFY